MDAARAVGYRESLLMQLNAVVLNWPKDQGAGGVVGAGGLKEGEVPRAQREKGRELPRADGHALRAHAREQPAPQLRCPIAKF